MRFKIETAGLYAFDDYPSFTLANVTSFNREAVVGIKKPATA
tara:strand:+ start:3192 stop:3317 length:126 start_codon:yes stop_codon:yes gene_type:complete